MTFDELKTEATKGVRISDEDWKTLTPEQQEELKKLRPRKKGNESNNPPKDTRRGFNDYTYYAVTEQIAKDLGSFPYNVMSGAGARFNFEGNLENSSIVNNLNGIFKEMSIAAIDVDFTPGWAQTKTDGINIAGSRLYIKVRKKNSGAKVYDQADLTCFLFAMIDIVANIMELRRMIGVAALYDAENKNLPYALGSALRVDMDDLQQNIANYRGRLNTLISKVNAIQVPKGFKVFERIDFAMSNIFADSSSIRGQFYCFRKHGYYIWSPTTSTQGSTLTYTSLSTSTKYTFAQRLAIVSEQVDALFLDTDANTMMGDIEKAYGENLYQISEVSEDYVVIPTMNEDALAQIENMVMLPNRFNGNRLMPTDAAMTITQNVDNQVLIFTPYVSVGTTPSTFSTAYIYPTTYMFNSHKDEPDYRDNLEWSRLHTIPYAVSSTGGRNIYFHSGLEFIWGMVLYSSVTNNSSGAITVPSGNVTQFYFKSAATSAPTMTREWTGIEQYDWHPIQYNVYYQYDSSTNVANILSIQVAGDLKKYTTVSRDTLASLDDAAITALFWPPEATSSK